MTVSNTLESDMGTCQVQFRCSCGGTVTSESEHAAEMDLSMECGGCGRRHVVTITELRGAADDAPIIER